MLYETERYTLPLDAAAWQKEKKKELEVGRLLHEEWGN
jgi:hypothetical protein